MVDPFRSAASALDLTDRLLTIRDISENADAKLAIAELKIELATVKETLAGLIDENRKLKAQLGQKANEPTLRFDEIENTYVSTSDEVRYCVQCYETDKSVRCLTRRGDGGWKCPVCHWVNRPLNLSYYYGEPTD